MVDKPCQLRRIEFLLDAVVQRRPTWLRIQEVHIGASLRKKPRSLEFLPHPRGEKRRHADDDVDLRAGFDEQIEIADVVVPRGGEQSAAGGVLHLGAACEQQLDERCVSPASDGEEERGAAILLRRQLRLDVESAVEQ